MKNLIVQWLGLADPRVQLDNIDLFLQGATIPALSARAGGGPEMIAEQRWIESELRNYIFSLEQQIADLEAEISELQSNATR